MRVGAIVLAAGESRRMGRVKATLPYGDSTVLETILKALEASAVDAVTVVLGRNWEQVYAAIEDLDVEVFVNPRPERGMLSSAQWALGQLRDDLDGFLFVLGDQPQIRTETVNALLAAAERSRHGILLPTFEGKRGHPLLLRANYKEEILHLPHTVALNALLQAHPDDVEEVPVSSATGLKDIDTPEEYAQALREEAERRERATGTG